MMFSSIAVLLTGRLVVRSISYFLIKSGIAMNRLQPKEKKNAERNAASDKPDRIRNNMKMSVWDMIQLRKQMRRAVPQMVPFHRPFRRLFRSAAIVSAILSLLHAHCWSRTLSMFKVFKKDGAGFICQAAFAPFEKKDEIGADEQCIWALWSACICIMIVVYAQDEFNGLHYKAADKRFEVLSAGDSEVEIDADEYLDPLDYSSDDSDPITSQVLSSSLRTKGMHVSSSRPKVEEPEDTLPMVTWLSLLCLSSTIDIFLQLNVFLGRVDARVMQPAVQDKKKWYEHETSDIGKLKDPSAKFKCLQEKYPGCMFDYTMKKKADQNSDRDDGFWFDFMADCGDGFNSSYQVARMLAQREIQVEMRKGVKEKNTKILPRGEMLVLGGDLAYPDPTERNFEKRFFRTFEDAMAPPPSFRRSKIATNKFNISTNGWEHDLCFEKGYKAENSNDDKHDQYKGPSTFIIPGNHDWYDGLATFSRLILCREWLGGWMMPQQRSYFATKLPNGWWIFGFDCALSADIDIEQFKFFAEVADNLVASTDSIILVNHEPHWVTDFDYGKSLEQLSERNIRELMDHHLRGKVRLRLAGDLHHYTRHVPLVPPTKPMKMSRSLSFDSKPSHIVIEEMKSLPIFTPFEEESKPDLIVSGGGGAFLHGVTGYSKNIKVGPKQSDYSRVAAYPNENISRRLGWLNMWNFRWRNWRCDLIFASLYLGIVSSLYPLCGILDDYEVFNPTHDNFKFVIWLVQKIWSLFLRIVFSERMSLLCCVGFLFGALALQPISPNVKSRTRYFVAFSHACAHIAAALTCVLFVQCVAEWSVREGIVNIASSVTERHVYSTPGAGISATIYDEYRTHFYPVLKNFTVANSHTGPQFSRGIGDFDSLPDTIKQSIEFLNNLGDYLFSTVPLLKTTLNFYDLPSLVAQNHNEMCSILCAGGIECLFSHDETRYHHVKREVFVPYLAAVTLYFMFLAIPIAGSIFGTWLSVCLNILECHNDLAFSSLCIQHYKNFVKLHITANGELEVYAIGLDKVPTRWMKDPAHKGAKCQKGLRTVSPSWLLDRPSKWLPMRESKRQDPTIIDYTCIPKRRIKSS
uniref:Calcineurin-like phosphoesterase domain-containing protein n=1 Tax=Chaetoceros debilis TaxID=122233 RepID=A0A7S3PVC3_9STRA